jgi:hypothetical protein
MSRRPAPAGPAISLFPFLAVLLCTMGSLLVLLVLFSSSARQAETAVTTAAARQHEEELELAREELAWRLDQLRGVRQRTADELAKARLQLAGIEDDGRALADELEQLERTAASLEEAAGSPDDEAAISDLAQRLAAARAALERARQESADRPPAYAVVPFEGSGGTRRRPLYIECCIDGVFLQPEGIRLGPADFEGPPGPGNPLASGLRAAREHLAGRLGESGDPAVQPYPLLIVRPSGVMAYYAAREALQSWGSDFGYQFIDEDWELTYPPADPALAEVEMRAIAEARRRLEWLAQVRPQPRTKPAVQYRASSTRGGVVATGGPTVLGDQSRWDWTEEQAAAAAGRGFRADGGSGDAVLGGGNGTGTSESRWPAGNQTASGGGSGEQFLGPSKFYGGSGASGAGGAGEGSAGSGTGVTGGPDAAGSADGLAGSSRATAGSELAGDLADRSGASGQTGPGGLAAGGAGPGDLASSGAGSGTAEGGGSSGGAGEATGGSQGSAGGGGGSFGPAPPGMSDSQPQAVSGQGGPSGSGSLAARRGSNWASLASQDRPIPLTRPIRLECAADEFRILGSGGRVTARVPIGNRTADAVDPLVRQVHATVGDWGMAGDRMYWKPELVLSAAPDGAGRRDDLEQLLADSGLDTRRAGDADTIRSLPPVGRTRGVSFPR